MDASHGAALSAEHCPRASPVSALEPLQPPSGASRASCVRDPGPGFLQAGWQRGAPAGAALAVAGWVGCQFHVCECGTRPRGQVGVVAEFSPGPVMFLCLSQSLGPPGDPQLSGRGFGSLGADSRAGWLEGLGSSGTVSDELRPCVQWEGCQSSLLNRGLCCSCTPAFVSSCTSAAGPAQCQGGSVPKPHEVPALGKPQIRLPGQGEQFGRQNGPGGSCCWWEATHVQRPCGRAWCLLTSKEAGVSEQVESGYAHPCSQGPLHPRAQDMSLGSQPVTDAGQGDTLALGQC